MEENNFDSKSFIEWVMENQDKLKKDLAKRREKIDYFNEKITKDNYYDNLLNNINIEYVDNKDNKKDLELYNRLNKYLLLKRKQEISDSSEDEDLLRKITVLYNTYKDIDKPKKEIELYKQVGCTSQRDMLITEIDFIINKLSKRKQTPNIVNTIKLLELNRVRVANEEFEVDIKKTKKFLVTIELLFDMDVSLLSVIDELYEESITKSKERRLK